MANEKKYRWHKIFSSEEELRNNVPSRRIYTVNIEGKGVCIVHGADGFYAVRDKCPHNGFPLNGGYCSDVNSIVCPVHRYHFDLKTGRALSGIGARVETYPVKITAQGVFLGVEEFNWWPF